MPGAILPGLFSLQLLGHSPQLQLVMLSRNVTTKAVCECLNLLSPTQHKLGQTSLEWVTSGTLFLGSMLVLEELLLGSYKSTGYLPHDNGLIYLWACCRGSLSLHQTNGTHVGDWPTCTFKANFKYHPVKVLAIDLNCDFALPKNSRISCWPEESCCEDAQERSLYRRAALSHRPFEWLALLH